MINQSNEICIYNKLSPDYYQKRYFQHKTDSDITLLITAGQILMKPGLNTKHHQHS